MIDNTDLNDLPIKAMAINTKPKVLNIEVERVAFEKSWVESGGSMKYFTWVASDWRYIIRDENAYLYQLSPQQINELMKMISASWAFWLSRAEMALSTEANMLDGLSKHTLIQNSQFKKLKEVLVLARLTIELSKKALDLGNIDPKQISVALSGNDEPVSIEINTLSKVYDLLESMVNDFGERNSLDIGLEINEQ